MCAATDPANFEFEFGYKTVPGFNCNVWHRPPLPPAFKTPDGKEEYGVIADSFCMSRNPFDRLASQYRYRASVDAREAPPTCDALSDFVDEHLEKLESNALLACLKRGVVAPAECQYHIRARLTRENKLSLDEIDDASSYGAEDCHFLPQTMYTRACETVFELEEYDAAVAPFLEKALSLPPGTAASAEAQSKKAKANNAIALGARDEAAPSDAQKALEYLTTGDPAARAARVKADEAKAKAGTDGALSAAWAQNLDAKDKKEAAEEPKRRSSAETRGGHRSSSSASKKAKTALRRRRTLSKQASCAPPVRRAGFEVDFEDLEEGVLEGDVLAPRDLEGFEVDFEDLEGDLRAHVHVGGRESKFAALRIVEMYKTDFEELGYEASPPKGPLDFGGAAEASLGAPAEDTASVFPGAQRAWARQHVLSSGDAETLDDAVAMMGDWEYHRHKEVGPGSGWEWNAPPPPPAERRRRRRRARLCRRDAGTESVRCRPPRRPHTRPLAG